MELTPLAAAMAQAVAASATLKVPLDRLIAAAAAVDRTGAVSVGWRARVADAIGQIEAAGLATASRSRWDETAQPRLPAFVMRVPAQRQAKAQPSPVVWHAELGWAAQLEAAGQLGQAERRFLVHVNTWLRRRGNAVVPQRERSLDICGDEKALDSLVFGPLFRPGRLTYELLRCEPCWPPVHQEILGDGPWLVVENWTTYRTLCSAASGNGWDGRLIWGAGNQVGTRLASLAASRQRPANGIFYFGDIDSAGFRIARMAADRCEEFGLGVLRAAASLYHQCLLAGAVRPGVKPAADGLANWIREWVGGGLGDGLAAVVADGGRIVQEAVGAELLARVEVSRLLPAADKSADDGPSGTPA